MVNLLLVIDGDEMTGEWNLAVRGGGKESNQLERDRADELNLIIAAWWEAADALRAGAKIAVENKTMIYENPIVTAELMISHMRNSADLEKLKEVWVEEIQGKTFKAMVRVVETEEVPAEVELREGALKREAALKQGLNVMNGGKA